MPNVFENGQELQPDWCTTFFGNTNPIVLELGCGRGEYTVNLARRYPNSNFIGVDYKGPRVWKGAGIALKEGLKNVAFLRIRIENILEYLQPHSIAEIWIPFPDPYPKKSKQEKRLVSKRFMEIYQQLLVPNGIIHHKTDNEDLFNFALETMAEMKLNLLAHTFDLHTSPYLDELTGIHTKYEAIFMAEGLKIKYLKAKI